MTNEERLIEYGICRARGHQSGDIVLSSMPPWSTCKWCGTAYRHETTLVETQVPSSP